MYGFDANSSTWDAIYGGSTPSAGQFNIVAAGGDIYNLVISQTDNLSSNMTSWLTNIQIGDILQVREVNNSVNVGYFKFTSVVVNPNPIFSTATLSHLSGFTTTTPGIQYFLGYAEIGPPGATGVTGATGPTGTAALVKAYLVASAQPPGTTDPTTNISYGEIEAIFFDVSRGSIIYKFAGSTPTFLELIVDPPGSTTNSTTQPRLTITNFGNTYPN